MTLQSILLTEKGPRGPRGSTLLVTGAAPDSSVDVDGDAAHDTVNGVLYHSKTNGAWDLTKKVPTSGPVGDQGITTYAAPPELLSNFNYVASDPVGLTSPYAAATGPLQMTRVGMPDVRGEYTPTWPSAFLGASLTNYGSTVAQTYSLVNLTTGATVYTTGAITGTSDVQPTSVGPFAATQYPMAANNTYVWVATNASSVANNYCVVTPYYAQPAQGGVALSQNALAVYGVAGETITTTNALMYHPGPVTGLRQALKNPKGSYFVNAWVQNACSVPVVCSIANLTITAPANSAAAYGPYSPDTMVAAANTFYGWVVRTSSGSTTGLVAASLQVGSTP